MRVFNLRRMTLPRYKLNPLIIMVILLMCVNIHFLFIHHGQNYYYYVMKGYKNITQLVINKSHPVKTDIEFRPICIDSNSSYCHPVYSTNIFPKNLCYQECDFFIAVFVFSATNNTSERTLIRKTWGGDVNSILYGIKIIFVVGKTKQLDIQRKIEFESRVYNDMLQGEFMDTYDNMVLKSVLSFNWFRKYLKGVSYFMKTDDDVLLNINVLINYLNAYHKSKSNIYLGRLYFENINYVKWHRWYVDPASFPFKKFPPYAGGVGYVLSNISAINIAAIMSQVPRFQLEDAYIGECIYRLNKKPSFLDMTAAIADTFVPSDAYNRQLINNWKHGEYILIHHLPKNLFYSFWTLRYGRETLS